MGPADRGPETPGSHPLRLKAALQQIHKQDCPYLPNPPGCKKRAAVALVIRVRPTYPHHAVYDKKQCSSLAQPFRDCLDSFFSQEWVQEGDAEVLFIKRAARVGDRWTGHIALPGGKREPADSHDRATSSRETREETGLELDTEDCVLVGNLPERVIKSGWSEEPWVSFFYLIPPSLINWCRLMVLCPFVYLALRHDLPPLTLQPKEVHSAHWVALRGLLAPSLRIVERWDLSKGSVRQKGYIVKMLTRATAGYMLFGGIKLKPTESLFCSSDSGFIPESISTATWTESATHMISHAFTGDRTQSVEDDRSLVLWGLTMGIMADFLELLDIHGTSKLWYWPTFSPVDLRAMTSLLTYRFRAQKLRELTTTASRPGPDDVRVSGFDASTFTISVRRQSAGSESGIAGGLLLEGYFDRLFKALYVALVARFGFGLALMVFVVRRYRRRVK
ncbi:MAG: hypothetical protein ASARMPREDX12_002994 [Alectoria sarmentosa]|nr:MAG: hypothetical protein ASARMPRED_005054 [Alectoria sarmentosa]CAD6587756.1 MAG: hypothetical protein ASARMPREDX12_002994 [Alectoria sarmentosa]